MSAKFVKNDDSCLCNICSETIELNDTIGLKCNPKKHIFCYECILDWYVQSNKNTSLGNYNMRNMCPICRKSGGLLPVHTKFKSIKGIHDFKENVNSLINETSKLNILDINPSKLPKTCGAKLKTKTGYCVNIGKQIYGGFCGIHSKCNVQQTAITTDGIIQDNTLIV